MAPPDMYAASNLPKKRYVLTDTNRFRIRKRNHNSSRHQSGLVKWWQDEGGNKLDQGQISQILSSKYNYLDSLDKKKDKKQLKVQKNKVGAQLDLEAALFEQQQRMQKKNAVITGDVLKAKAAELQAALPQYADQPQPKGKQSNGWLDGFKKRYRIKEYVQHGEAAGAAIHKATLITSINEVRTVAAVYHP